MAFEGKVALITGAAGVLGRAVAEAFEALGASLVLVDRQTEALTRTFGADHERQRLIAVDLLDAQAVLDAVSQAHAQLGRLDVLCNIAGGFTMGEAVHEMSDATWQRMLDLNVRTMLNASRAVVPLMLAADSGRVVNVAAHAAQRGGERAGAYAAAKSAVIRLTESMAAELRMRGINVNCVLPTILDTPDNRAAMPRADPSHWVAPAALADVIVFLASDGARAMHGAAVPVTGLS
jgi:NAD(P)-dependent dehydrogenase (short-subunit alcohol dehydrogenase family)